MFTYKSNHIQDILDKYKYLFQLRFEHYFVTKFSHFHRLNPIDSIFISLTVYFEL